jgi:hypothetical protein
MGLCLQGPIGFAQTQAPPLYDNLGQHHYPLSIRNPQAQAYFYHSTWSRDTVEPGFMPATHGQQTERDHFMATPTRHSPGASNPAAVSKLRLESSTSLHTESRS